MLNFLSKTVGFRSKPLAAVPILALAQNESGYQYLLASPKGKKWLIESFGEIKAETDSQPESPLESINDEDNGTDRNSWDSILNRNWLQPKDAEVRGRRVVLCMQRPDVEFYSLQTMFDSGEDPTESLHNELIIREKISLDDLTIDYVQNVFGESETISFAAGVPKLTAEKWLESAKNRGLKVEQVFFRALATASLVGSLDEIQAGSCLLLCVYGQQADLVLLHDRKPCFIRNLVLPHSESVAEVVSQLISEIRLSVSSLDLPFLDDALSRALVVAESDIATELIIQLKMELDIDSVQIRANDLPEIQWREEAELPTTFFPLLGCIHQTTQTPGPLLLDLLNPKQIVEPPSMIRRIALLSVLLLMVLGYFGMSLYDQYQANHQELLKIVANARKDKAAYEKGLPEAQLVQFVQRWQAPEVQWLEQLQALTEKLPSGDLAVIRQFSGQQTAEGAKISMQIHVRDLEVTKSIEQSIQDSGLRLDFRRVVETQDQEYPFRLETTVLAPHRPGDSRQTETAAERG